MARTRTEKSTSTANLGFEAKLWLAADKFRNVQHPDFRADYVLANGSMSSNQSGEGDIRRALIKAGLVDCMVALPGQLFYSTQIPVCLWFLAKNKATDAKRGFRDRLGLKNRLVLVA